MRRAGLLWVSILLATSVTTPTVQAEQRSGVGPCRQGVLSLIARLDAGEQGTPDFSRVARDVIETCGPTTVHSSGPAEIAQAPCRQLALNMLDTIESGKMGTRAFTWVKTAFAVLRPALRRHCPSTRWRIRCFDGARRPTAIAGHRDRGL